VSGKEDRRIGGGGKVEAIFRCVMSISYSSSLRLNTMKYGTRVERCRIVYPIRVDYVISTRMDDLIFDDADS
jgi:hypothetical protein